MHSCLLSSKLSSRRLLHLSIDTHYTPNSVPCEIMTCGETDSAVIDYMMDATAQHGFKPFRCLKEGTGFI